MEKDKVLQEFRDAGAILSGHFILSSGLHSPTYLQCARVLMEASRAERLCSALTAKVSERLKGQKIDMVVAPAMGGVVVGYEMGRQLAVPSIFCERVDGSFAVRRGFEIPQGARVLLVEDVVTTGKSSMETVECVRQHGGEVIGEACLVNRSGEAEPMNFPLVSLLELTVPTYKPDQLPPELQAIPAVKPGSRWLKAS